MLMNVHTGTYIPSGGRGNKGLRQTMHVRGEEKQPSSKERGEGGYWLDVIWLRLSVGRKRQTVFTVRSFDRSAMDR